MYWMDRFFPDYEDIFKMINLQLLDKDNLTNPTDIIIDQSQPLQWDEIKKLGWMPKSVIASSSYLWYCWVCATFGEVNSGKKDTSWELKRKVTLKKTSSTAIFT